MSTPLNADQLRYQQQQRHTRERQQLDLRLAVDALLPRDLPHDLATVVYGSHVAVYVAPADACPGDAAARALVTAIAQRVAQAGRGRADPAPVADADGTLIHCIDLPDHGRVEVRLPVPRPQSEVPRPQSELLPAEPAVPPAPVPAWLWVTLGAVAGLAAPALLGALRALLEV